MYFKTLGNVPHVLEALFTFLTHFSGFYILSEFYWSFSSSLILSLVISTLILSLSSMHCFVCLLHFSLLIFLFVLFNGFYFFSDISCSFSCFRVIFDCALNECYHSCFKIHLIVPDTCDSSQYWHHWVVFSHYVVIFLVLGIVCSFLLYL